jgi:hypothetical protein
MSLNVYLETKTPKIHAACGRIFLRESGQTKEVSREEWDRRHPGVEPVMIHEEEGESSIVYSSNITHNLGKMAYEAGIYQALWRPDEIGIEQASGLIPLLEVGLTKLKDDPEQFKKFNPENGWGNHGVLVDFVEGYLRACREHPESLVRVSR